MAAVIGYQVSEAASAQLMYQCGQLGCRYVEVTEETEGLTLREHLEGKRKRAWKGRRADQAMIVMCGFDRRDMDRLLDAMRVWKREKILKAVLTETNGAWTCPQLLRELIMEDEAMHHA